jgi:hypothetical protein
MAEKGEIGESPHAGVGVFPDPFYLTQPAFTA